MSIVIAVMMVAYVSIPSRLIGMKTTYSRTDKLKAAAVAARSAPSSARRLCIGRIGILMLGSHVLFILASSSSPSASRSKRGDQRSEGHQDERQLVAGQKLDTPSPTAGPPRRQSRQRRYWARSPDAPVAGHRAGGSPDPGRPAIIAEESRNCYVAGRSSATAGWGQAEGHR